MSSDIIEMKEDHLDFLVELLTIGAGRSAEILSEMLDTYIQLSIPSIKQIDVKEFSHSVPEYLNQEVSVIDLMFKGDVSGESKLIFPSESARILGNLLLDANEDEDFDSAKIGVLTEVGNIILNSIMGTISNYLEIKFDYQIPVFQHEFTSNGLDCLSNSADTILLADTRFIAEEHSIQGNIALLFTMKSMEDLTKLMDKYLEKL
jgi:chemotaxis protein CheC